MNKQVTITLEAARKLAMKAMRAHNFGDFEAMATTEALLNAERDGLPSHGLSRLPFYLEQAATGKVDATAIPKVEVDGAVVRVDAGHGLAFPAVTVGVKAGIESARKYGLSAVSIARSHHFGVAGAPVEVAANQGLMAMGFSNAPSAIAPWGGSRPLYGTNPIAFACPRRNAEPLLIDLSLSKVARGKVMLAKKAGKLIPDGWALDVDGRPTTDPDAAIAGSMLPAGDAKGATLALMVELLTAGLAGGHFGFQASSFFEAEGDAPNTAHLILLFDPERFSSSFSVHIETLFEAMLDQPGVRLPGDRRYQLRREFDGILLLPSELVANLERHAGVVQ